MPSSFDPRSSYKASGVRYWQPEKRLKWERTFQDEVVRAVEYAVTNKVQRRRMQTVWDNRAAIIEGKYLAKQFNQVDATVAKASRPIKSAPWFKARGGAPGSPNFFDQNKRQSNFATAWLAQSNAIRPLDPPERRLSSAFGNTNKHSSPFGMLFNRYDKGATGFASASKLRAAKELFNNPTTRLTANFAVLFAADAAAKAVREWTGMNQIKFTDSTGQGAEKMRNHRKTRPHLALFVSGKLVGTLQRIGGFFGEIGLSIAASADDDFSAAEYARTIAMENERTNWAQTGWAGMDPVRAWAKSKDKAQRQFIYEVNEAHAQASREFRSDAMQAMQRSAVQVTSSGLGNPRNVVSVLLDTKQIRDHIFQLGKPAADNVDYNEVRKNVYNRILDKSKTRRGRR